MTGARRALVAIVVAVAAVAGAGALLWGGGREVRVTIVAGTGDRLDEGDAPDVVAPRLELSVGDEMVVTNRDDRLHLVGPLTVRPGATLRHRFDEVGTTSYPSTVSPGGSVLVVVT